MAAHLATKLLSSHCRDRDPDGSLYLTVDQILVVDASGVLCALQFEELGVAAIAVPLAVMYIDHNVLQIDERNMEDHRYLRSFCAKYGLVYSRPGNGISHYVHMERFGVPGQVVAGADSHTTMAGSLGMLGVGLGGLDIALAMASGTIVLAPQRVVRVVLQGNLRPWVSAKDIVLELLRRLGVRGGTGSIFEFIGDSVAALSVTERGTIANMMMETGATTALFPSDERTREWLSFQGRPQDWRPLEPDDGAVYDDEIVLDLAELEPLIALPSSPGNVVRVADVAGEPVAQVCIGSSVNSSYDDLAIVAAVLSGAVVSECCEVTATPGSRQILNAIAETGIYAELLRAGVRMLEPVCGPCVGVGQAPLPGVPSVRTFNRNFPGRSGTLDDRVYLCSPQTAAATALRGTITDPRTLSESPPFIMPLRKLPPIDPRHFIFPVVEALSRPSTTVRGRNIAQLPVGAPLRDRLDQEVLIVLPDDVSTGDMAPDGVLGMANWANIPECAKLIFRRYDPSFYERVRNVGGGIVVSGHNYGQGSSRESAALVLVELGIRVVVARSFARIHRTNLIAHGIVPLLMSDGDHANQGDRWTLEDLRTVVVQGETAISVSTNSGDVLCLKVSLTPNERSILCAGGALRMFRAETRTIDN